MRLKKKPTLAKRTYSIYCHQTTRKNGMLRYTLTQLRNLVAERVAVKQCPYCRAPLTTENFSVDHERPISRGGSWAMENLVVCCRRCNDAKGSMTGSEWLMLLELMGKWSEEDGRQDVWRRLRAGGPIRRGKR